MSRPEYQRTSSTNLGTEGSSRPLEGKLAIVTGSSRGIGAAIARNLASKGASLVLNYTSDKSAEITTNLAKDLESTYNIKVLGVQADLGNEKGPAHLVNFAKTHFSHPRSGIFQIDILINNAGVSKNLTLEEITAENFHWQYNVNVLGPILLMQAALPYLPTDRSGRIVNLSSVSSSMGLEGQTVYGGTKAALEAMTRTWARELGERATVNAVNPGPVQTDMYGETTDAFRAQIRPHIQQTPLMRERKGVDPQEHVDAAKETGGRPGYDYEIAGVVAMWCGPDAAWCTGSVVCSNGVMKFSY